MVKTKKSSKNAGKTERNVFHLRSADPDPKSWLFKLVDEHNKLQDHVVPKSNLENSSKTPLEWKLDLVSEVVLARSLLHSFYSAMKDPQQREKCRGKVDGTTPDGLGGKSGVVKNAFTVASLLDATYDEVRDWARNLKDGEILEQGKGWEDVKDEEMRKRIGSLADGETVREKAEREGELAGLFGQGRRGEDVMGYEGLYEE